MYVIIGCYSSKLQLTRGCRGETAAEEQSTYHVLCIWHIFSQGQGFLEPVNGYQYLRKEMVPHDSHLAPSHLPSSLLHFVQAAN